MFRHAPPPTVPPDDAATEIIASIQGYAAITPSTTAAERERILTGIHNIYFAAAEAWEDVMDDAQGLDHPEENRVSLATMHKLLGFTSKSRSTAQSYIRRARQRRKASA